MNVGENIRRCRREKDLKAEQVYEQIGISQSKNSGCLGNYSNFNLVSIIFKPSLINFEKAGYFSDWIFK